MKPNIKSPSLKPRNHLTNTPASPAGVSEKSVQVQFTNYAYGGEAIGRLPDGRAIFVPYVIKGEIALVEIVEEHPRFARGRLIEVLEPSIERILARCVHFGVCGGCHYQHMSYAAQLEAKSTILADQLERLGGFKPPVVLPPIPATQAWNYRNHVQFHLARPAQDETNSSYRLGFVAAFPPRHSRMAERDITIIPIEVCHLPEDALNCIWPEIEIEPGAGLERISLRAGSDGQVLMTLESANPNPPEFSLELPISAVHLSPAGKIILAGNEYLTMQVREREFRISAGAFFQVNAASAELMVDHVLHHLALNGQETVVDLYSGAGLFSAFLAAQAAHLVAVEINPAACTDFEYNLSEFDNVVLYESAVEDALPEADVHPQIILLDPPRAGMTPAARRAMLRLEPETIVYVSCDPATLARDGKEFIQAGYQCRQLTLFDLFPQTCHIESVSIWRYSSDN